MSDIRDTGVQHPTSCIDCNVIPQDHHPVGPSRSRGQGVSLPGRPIDDRLPPGKHYMMNDLRKQERGEKKRKTNASL